MPGLATRPTQTDGAAVVFFSLVLMFGALAAYVLYHNAVDSYYYEFHGADRYGERWWRE